MGTIIVTMRCATPCHADPSEASAMAVVRLAQALAVVRACACVLTEQVPPPQPLLRGLHDTPSVSEIHEVDGRTVYLRALHDELQLTYVHGEISHTFLSGRPGWMHEQLA
eukprot:6194229-Pleurochrysis_carterae.AAC.3